MTKTIKKQNITDNLVAFIDTSLRTLFGQPISTNRKNPAAKIKNIKLSTEEQKLSASLMRVNHCGEVCAQALYQGQAITARAINIKNKLHQASLEENDHLNWCKYRIDQLNSHTSYLNPLWYLGSLSIGIIAGLAGDKYNLGFLAETEKQVTLHLEYHLKILPSNDIESKAILEQMKIDEQEHATTAIDAGAIELPEFIKITMQLSSKIMTNVSYYI